LEDLCFHAQQAAEKSIKAVLRAHGIPFPKTHNLDIILDLLPADVSLPPDDTLVGGLSQYAVMTRYPGMDEPVTKEEYREAIRLAVSVVKWAEDLLRQSGGL
jgi:HEPN domain-containing protein